MNKTVRRGNRVGLSHSGQYSARGSGSALTLIKLHQNLHNQLVRNEPNVLPQKPPMSILSISLCRHGVAIATID